MTTLSELIRLKRQNQKLSLREFADKCGLSHSYIKNLEEVDPRSGKLVVPTIESMEKLASAMDMTLEELLRETGYIAGNETRFEPTNLKLLRGSRSYEQVCEDIFSKTGSKVDPAVYKSIEEGNDNNPTPIFIEILARYAGVKRSFFYRKNTQELLEYSLKMEPYRYPESEKECIKYLQDDSFKEFLKDPAGEEYMRLAKELYDKKIKVKFVRDTLFSD